MIWIEDSIASARSSANQVAVAESSSAVLLK